MKLFDVLTEQEIISALTEKPEPDDLRVIAEYEQLSRRLLELGVPRYLVTDSVSCLVAIDNHIRKHWSAKA